MTHTAAPWTYEPSDGTGRGDGGMILAASQQGAIDRLAGAIAFMYGDLDPHGRANGQLISAAPDLLAALEMVRDDVAEKAREAVVDEDDVREEFEEKLRAVDAAIAKARQVRVRPKVEK